VSYDVPGRYAETRYRKALASWQRRAIRPLVLVLAFFASALLAVAIWRDGGLWWFAGGLVAGFAATVWTFALELGPAYIQNWKLGADGEKLTAKALRPLLKEGWQVCHDLSSGPRRGNIDHVLVGPNGVFLLETKWLRGRIRVEDDLVVTRQIDDDEAVNVFRLAPRVRAGAAEMAEKIGEDVGRRPWVQPVVVLWGHFEQEIIEGQRIAFVHGSRLAGWLRSQPPAGEQFELI
jgi:hypothetical protein